MTSNFSINRIFEENMQINFSINAGIFTIPGQTYVIQHFAAIQNLANLTSWNHVVLNSDANNYFTVDYRWSFEKVTISFEITHGLYFKIYQ